MDEHTLHILEFDKILARLADYASFGPGKARILAWRPTNDLGEARLWQQETEEARRLLSQQPDLHLGGVHDLQSILGQAERGGVLPPNDLLHIRSSVLRSRRLRQLLLANARTAPALADWGERLHDLEHLAAAIGRAVSDRGEVMDSASPRLARLRSEIHVLQDRVAERIQRIARNPDNAPYLQETIVTQRQGRYVLPVRAEFKGKIPGIVHDQSGSGATLFVEPFSIVEMNNDLRQRQAEEEEEVMQKLRTSIKNSKRLQKHIEFLFSHGSMYLAFNSNLLFHGCIPMTKEGGEISLGKTILEREDKRCVSIIGSLCEREDEIVM
jgi:DNA mismatch repair protein MutS2